MAARRLEAVIHALHVELEGDMRGNFANEVGKIDDTIGATFLDRADDIIELGDVAAYEVDLIAEFAEGGLCADSIDVHAGDAVALANKDRDKATADEACSADCQNGHGICSCG